MNVEEAIKILDYKINMYKEDVFIGDLDKTNIEAIKKVLKEIERLNHLLEDVKIHLESYDYDNMPLDARVLATNISLIINGTIKVVR